MLVSRILLVVAHNDRTEIMEILALPKNMVTPSAEGLNSAFYKTEPLATTYRKLDAIRDTAYVKGNSAMLFLPH